MITKKQIVDYYNNREHNPYYNTEFEEELLEAIRQWIAIVSITRDDYSQDKLPCKESLIPNLRKTSLIPIDRLVNPQHFVIGCDTIVGSIAIDVSDLVGNFTGDKYLLKYVEEMEAEQEKLLLQIGKYQDKIDVAKNNWKKYKEREKL